VTGQGRSLPLLVLLAAQDRASPLCARLPSALHHSFLPTSFPPDAPIQVVTFEAKPRIPCAIEKKTARMIDLVTDFRT